MGTPIDLTAIYVTDFVGIIILIILLVSRGWSLPARKKESTAMFLMIVASMINCAMDAYVSYCDGKPGLAFYTVAMIGNTYLFLYYLIVGIGVIFLVVKHIEKSIIKLQIVFFAIIAIIEVALLFINFFYPIVFGIDEENLYYRGPFYFIFILAGFLLIFYGYAYYFLSKIKNPSLRYFPVFEFLMPILVGVIIQTKVYGISLQPISFVIAFAGILIALQNECIYIDKLTGVYNRYELDRLLGPISRKRKEKIAALMLDLNGFKAINDDYSHDEGDRALVDFAEILVRFVKYDGVVIRFAGDEFIIILRRIKDFDLDDYKKRLHEAVDAYNETSGKPYELSVAIGGKIIDFTDGQTMDVMTDIDKLMYKDKDDYYKDRGRNR